MEVLSEVMNGKVKDTVDSIKKVLTKKPEMLEEQIRDKVPVEKEDKLTLGTVQSKIKKGMNQTEVLEVLGSPNIVTKNKSGNEVWTYDKVGSSQSSTSGVSATYGQAQLNQGFWAFLFGGTTNSAQSNSDSSTESKSLTVIITFNSK